MKCHECGSTNIMWDYRTGSIVCCNCGLVLDIIYEYKPLKPYMEKSREVKTFNETKPTISKAYIIKQRIDKHYRRNYRIKETLKILSKINKKNLVIDEKALQEYLDGKRGHVKILKHEAGIKLDDTIKILVEKVINSDPILASRTERAKVAIAYLLLKIVSNEHELNLHEVAKKTSLSVTHVKRLLSLIRKRPHVLYQTRNILLYKNNISTNVLAISMNVSTPTNR